MKSDTVTLDYGCPMCQEQTPAKEAVLQPFTIKRSLKAPGDFDCPHCGSVGHYQFIQLEGAEYIQWSIEHRLSFHYTYDCAKCGGKLTEYVRIGRVTDHALCLRCGAMREGNLTGSR